MYSLPKETLSQWEPAEPAEPLSSRGSPLMLLHEKYSLAYSKTLGAVMKDLLPFYCTMGVLYNLNLGKAEELNPSEWVTSWIRVLTHKA
jgi:hypothetical protein